MRFVTLESTAKCTHRGVVRLVHSQEWVRIDGKAILVENDPEGRDIDRCPNRSATIRPCLHTLKVREGYSKFIRIGEKPVVLDSVWGYTDGTPPQAVKYIVTDPGQEYVESAA